jgi:hypothetical protein
MHKFSLLAVALGILLALPAAAQSPPAQGSAEGTPSRIRGTIETLDGQNLRVKSRDGEHVTIGLADNFTVLGVAKRSLTDIKAGDYVASTSVRGTDGKLHALEIHIFPEPMRGVGEGQRPTDLVPDSLMTNATVAGISAEPQGQLLKVTYKGGEAEVIIAPDTPIVTYVPGDASLLKPGATIFCVAQKKADGSLTATRITAEKDGVKPPM